jgi:glycosyltransferase involved in cell wall biosynthesis
VKIVFLTPGTGSYYCGACMRDNALARELQRSGHDVTIAPMYLPLTLDETSLAGSENVPVFFGGINVYLQQKLALFRSAPAFVDRWLNSTSLLRWAAQHSHMTSAREHGEMTLEMLHVAKSRFRKEWDKLLDWLEQSEKPDLVCLSNALLAGFASEMKRRLGAPVVLFFQGEDGFLDGLPEPFRTDCWTALQALLPASDILISPSRFYAGFMQKRLHLAPGSIQVLPNGISLEGYSSPETAPVATTIGYLARMSRDKGLELLVESFLILAGELGDTSTRLAIAGAATASDRPLINKLQESIRVAGLTSRVEWTPNLTRDEKIAFLRKLTLFSVPAIYEEAFGLYVIEAMACGIPVVQPDSAAFTEIIATSGGGICVQPRNARALALAWKGLLADPTRRAELGKAGRLSVEKHFSAGKMAGQFNQIIARSFTAAT